MEKVEGGHECAKLLHSCPTLCNLMDCSPPGSSVHEILQSRILEWVAISFSMGSSWTRDRTQIPMSPALAGGFFTTRTTGKPWGVREVTKILNSLGL